MATMSNTEFHRRLKELRACDEGTSFVKQFRGPQSAWNAFERSDWMFWWVSRSSVSLEVQGKIARGIALSVSHLWKCPAVCKEYLENGKPELRILAAAAAGFAAAAAGGSAADAAYAACSFADAACSFADAADAAASYAYAAASAAAAAASRGKQMKLNCEIIRRHIPKCPKLEKRK